MTSTTHQHGQAGVALLSALWLSLILGAIAFGVAAEVRTSADSTANNIAMSQAKYFAEGGIHAAVAAIQSRRAAPTAPVEFALDQYRDGQRWLAFTYGAGVAVVEVVPENAKLAVNHLTSRQVEDVLATASANGTAPAGAGDAVQHWRSPRLSGVDTAFDAAYAQAQPPYRANHGALQDLEELIAVQGIGKSAFFGAPQAFAGGAGAASDTRTPLLDLLHADTRPFAVNINYARYEVLATLPGWTAQLAGEVVAARRDDALLSEPFVSLDDLVRRVPAAASVVGVSSFTLSSGDVFTLTATGIDRDSGLSQTTRCIVRMNNAYPDGYKIIAWWDDWPWVTPPAGVIAPLKELL